MQRYGSAALTFSYGSGATCTLTGALAQFGQLYDMPGAGAEHLLAQRAATPQIAQRIVGAVG
jgi:hypothetical protein